MSRIHVININTPASSAGFVPVLQQDLDRVRRPDTRSTIDSIEPGLERALDASHADFNLLNKVSIVERALQAQRDGHQAVIVMCFMDPAVRESREVLDIPVIGVGEASMLYACRERPSVCGGDAGRAARCRSRSSGRSWNMDWPHRHR